MTFPIINILLLAENTDSGNPSVLTTILICTAVFIASSVISGITAFRIKSKKNRGNQTDSNKAGENKS
ncbi:MAG: hypothetical protein K2J37_02535 [Ruminococcus sp.]|nr:hypothetical protein [Ruminococcus sp.]MDE6784597.1 hypothetical protein [Ruminococcus sp.]